MGTPTVRTELPDRRWTIRHEQTKVDSLEFREEALRRENARLKEEREILRKATAFFARDAR